MATATNVVDHRVPAPLHAAKTRALSAAGATVAALAIWVLAVPVLGAHLLVRFGNGAPQTVGVGLIVGATFVGSLCGWALLAILERRTSGARTIWTGAAIVVVLVSLSLPLTAGTTMSTKFVLALMHVAVAAILIAGLRRD